MRNITHDIAERLDGMSIRRRAVARVEEWEQAAAFVARCQCQNAQIREMRMSNGATHLVRQCPDCGAQVGTFVGKDTVRPQMSRPPFDKDHAFVAGRAEEFAGQLRRRERSAEDLRQKRENYAEYLQSDDWRRKRRKVLDRAKGICEGCLERPATQVHHLTYQHVRNELLWELVAICDGCHARCHPEHSEANGGDDPWQPVGDVARSVVEGMD